MTKSHINRKNMKKDTYKKLKEEISDKVGEINDLKYRIKELEEENEALSEQLRDIEKSL